MEYLKGFEGIEFGDKRLSKRLNVTLNQLAQDPQGSVNRACGSPGAAKGAYRMVGNEKVTEEEIITKHREVTLERIRASGESVILVPQDLTELNYTTLEHTSGLGNIGTDKNLRGILMNSAIAVTPKGQIVGLLDQKLWVRPEEERGKKGSRKQRPIEEKESNRWLETMEAAEKGDHGEARLVHICDREGDIYEFFEKAAREGYLYLVRRTRNRRIEGSDHIDEYLEKQPIAGMYEVEIPRDSHTLRERRTATIEVRFGQVNILRPKNLGDSLSVSLTVSVISAREVNAPEGVEAIDWQLITNLVVEDFETAKKYIDWYARRWLIEMFHYTLKSGCAVEKLQSDTAERLRKLIAIYAIIALRIMIVTYIARTNPDVSCETFLMPVEWKVLYCTAKRTKKPPAKPPTAFEACVMIAQLGGFAGYKSNGFPGVKVMWWGMTKLMSILEALPFISNLVN